MGRKLSNPSESPVRGRGSPHRRSPSRREKSPARRKASHRVSPPTRGKPSSRSPSPQTKRLRRAQDERKDEKVSERERERNHGRGSDKGAHRERGMDKEILNERRGSDKGAHRERGLDKEILDERKERRSGRDENDGKSSRARHGRSSSPSDHHHRSRHRSHSPQAPSDSRARDEVTNSRGDEHMNDDDDSVAKMKAAEEALEEKQKQKPSFELSGKLAAETNRFRGVTLLFSEPPDARKPDIRWRLYVFKGGEVLNEPLYIHRQSCYLFGRERRVADIPTDHPSCSKQHAVIQFRQVEKEKPDGTSSKQARPYIMDLGSTNKTFINDNAIEPQRYYELFEKDTIKFGNSSREYVLLHENSAQ